MVMFEFPPSNYLSEFIRAYRIVDISSKENLPYKPYIPKPEQCLTFFPRDTEVTEFAQTGKTVGNYRISLYGQLTELTNRYVGKEFFLFQVVFRPGGLYRITGIPMHSLSNNYIDGETVFPACIKEVNEKLCNTTDYSKMVSIVEEFLIKQVKQRVKDFHLVDEVCHTVLINQESFKVEDLAKKSCLSIRQFERKFKERVGVSPKFYAKLARFGNAFRMKNKFPNLDWLTIALHCGYHDYQHLAKDYFQFTLQSPTDFHILDLQAPERIFGDKDLF